MSAVDDWSTPLLPTERLDPFHPPAEYRRFRDESPVQRVLLSPSGPVAWLVTRHDDAKAVLRDARFSSDNVSRRPQPRQRSLSSTQFASTLIRMDPPEHTVYRRALGDLFDKRKAAALRPTVQRLADKLLGQAPAARTSADLIPQLAAPLPVLVICHILGIPEEDAPYLQERATAATHTALSSEIAERAACDLSAYMNQFVRDRLGDPHNDAFSQFLAEYVGTGQCSPEAAADLACLFFVAGTSTTEHMLGMGILTLLQQPEQLGELRSNPDLIHSCVDELFRYLTVVRTLARIAATDTVIGDIPVHAGELVVISLSSANRDERRFSCPDRFDIHRASGGHLAFGYGPHLCLGAALARIELEAAITYVLHRLPGLQLAVPFEELGFRDQRTVYGVNSLPVTWGSD